MVADYLGTQPAAVRGSRRFLSWPLAVFFVAVLCAVYLRPQDEATPQAHSPSAGTPAVTVQPSQPIPNRSPATPSSVGGHSVSVLHARPEFDVYNASTAQDITVAIGLVSQNAEALAADKLNRQPVALSIVVDISGSMSGQPLDLVKRSLKFLTQFLMERDFVAITVFSSEAHSLLPMTAMSRAAKKTFGVLVDNLRAEGSTNLDHGLQVGVTQLKRFADAVTNETEYVQGVWLLTDGYQNTGVTQPDQIAERLRTAVRSAAPSATLHAFGYGDQHDSALLTLLTREGCEGAYYYVQQLSDVKTMFADALGSLLTVVATNVQVSYRSAGGAEVKKIRSAYGGSFPLTFASLSSEEQRDFIVVLAVPPATPAALDAAAAVQQPLGELVVTYVDEHGVHREFTHALPDVARRDVPPESRVPDAECASEILRADVGDALEEAQKRAQSGDMTGSLAMLETVSEWVADANYMMSTEPLALNETKIQYISEIVNSTIATLNATGASNATAGTHILTNRTQELRTQRATSSQSLYSNQRKAALRDLAAEDDNTP